ncbi:MAG: NUDIX hydrolase [Luteibaculaceae bacterium]
MFNNRKYANLNVSVDCVVFGYTEDHLKVLLIEQKKISPTIKPMFALPGDLILSGESTDDSAARVLKELTSLEGIFLRQFHTFSDPNRVNDLKDLEWLRSFRENPDERVITVAYYALVKLDEYMPSASSFAEKSVWQDVNYIPELAFDHNQIVEKAIDKLRFEVVNNQVGFELLPEKFTLSQLQRMHETILGKELDKRNFRKSIKKLENLVPLMEKQQGVHHKPGQLYSFAPACLLPEV